MDRICIVNNEYKQEEAVIEWIFPNFSAGIHLVRTKEQNLTFQPFFGKINAYNQYYENWKDCYYAD